MNNVQIKEFIIDFIKNNSNYNLPITDDLELISSHILSSLSLITLLVEIEEKLNTDIVSEKFGIEDFSSINSIINTINKVQDLKG